jgi:hypothetical protein
MVGGEKAERLTTAHELKWAADNEVGIEDREGEEEIMTEMGQKGRGRER